MDMWQDVKRHFLRTLKLGSRNIKNQAACSSVTSVVILFIIWLFVQKCSCSVVRQAPKRFLVDNRMLNAATDGIGYRPDPSCQGVSCIFTYFYNISHHNHHRFLVGLSLSLTLWICCASLCFFAQDSPKILRTLTSAAQPPGVLSSRHQWTSFVTSRDVTNLSMALWLYVWLRLCPSDFASKHFGCRKSCVFNVSSTCLQRVFNVFWECVLTCFVFFCPSRVLMRAVGSVCRMSCICPKSASAQSWRLHESSWFHPLSSAPLSSIDM